MSWRKAKTRRKYLRTISETNRKLTDAQNKLATALVDVGKLLRAFNDVRYMTMENNYSRS